MRSAPRIVDLGILASLHTPVSKNKLGGREYVRVVVPRVYYQKALFSVGFLYSRAGHSSVIRHVLKFFYDRNAIC